MEKLEDEITNVENIDDDRTVREEMPVGNFIKRVFWRIVRHIKKNLQS